MEPTPSNGSNVRARSRKANTSSTEAPSRRTARANGQASATALPVSDRAAAALPPFETYPAIAVENVQPELDGGRWPIKRVVGDAVEVAADMFKEGHDLLQARVIYHPIGQSVWNEAPMRLVENDRWVGQFTVDQNTRYVYSVLAFTDTFGSWRADLQKRLAAAQDVTSELLEGLRLVDEAAERSDDPSDKGRLEAYARRWRSLDKREAAELAISAELGDVMDRWPDRSDATRYRHELQLIVDRPAARFAAWYEIFPRSQGTDPNRSATFREAEARLPAIAGMGFDTLYMTPIHPIGTTNRKGPNNTLVAGPNDPGSPYAIGSPAGGHDAIAPELGTLDDFLHFQQVAREHGLELVLDFAIQVSPDHPWVKEHPEWFYHRPDGSIKFAENPPKKYEDIYPLNFRSPDWKRLWAAWRDLVLEWAERGVRVFRVDNPHTKPLAFWEWMINDVQSVYPDVIFLAEAFTRPKMMRQLAKAGFTQSYTYFTWRNTKRELQEYLTELTQTQMKEYYRGNFFANTPDILPHILQLGGRAAFRMRLVLAATLSSVYGIYSGFELCENVPVRKGSEEYIDSEKYQIKPRAWNQADSLRELIARVNAIRRDSPALQQNASLSFYRTDNPQLLWFGKWHPAGRVLIAVNTDPRWTQQGWVQVPIWEMGIEPRERYVVEDLLDGARYSWRGEWNFVKLDPAERVAHILVVRE
ncbi:MAG: alpha-1,4-glucan--maltose-1-phosphate maltosyltransferase [Acidobacteria bacterium]|nr:MAG: alpha-1,4-glucan--maltose-1-phosphate maltosyltransferase [Acidobacteriota bacterium]